MREKSQILVSHTGNTSIFAFAAEVEYHADAYRIASIFDSSTIKADMSISSYNYEEMGSGGVLSNEVVQAEISFYVNFQVDIHAAENGLYPDLLNEG